MAGEYEHIKGKGNRFSSTNQPANRGRKPSLYNHIKKLLGTEAKAELSKEDYFKLIQFLLEQPLDNLKKLADSKNTPIWIVGVVRAVVKMPMQGEPIPSIRYLIGYSGKHHNHLLEKTRDQSNSKVLFQ